MNARYLLVGMVLLLGLILPAKADTILPLNISCFSSAPNIETGNIAFGKGLSNASFFTDADPATHAEMRTVNILYVDLVSQYTITDVRLNVTMISTDSITIEGSPDNSTGSYLPMYIFTSLGANAYNNQSIYPVKNIRFIRFTAFTASGRIANVSDFQAYGHAETCFRSDIRFIGTTKGYYLIYRESSYSNPNDNRTIMYEDFLGNKLKVSDDTKTLQGRFAFDVLHQIINSFIYVTTSTDNTIQCTIRKINIASLTVVNFTTDCGMMNTVNSFGMYSNGTALMLYGNQLTGNNGGFLAYDLANGNLLANDVGAGGIGVQHGMGLALANGTSGDGEIFLSRNNIITKLSIKNLASSSNYSFIPIGTNVSVPEPFYNGSEYLVLFSSNFGGTWDIYSSQILNTTTTNTQITTTLNNEIIASSTKGLTLDNGVVHFIYQNGSGGDLILNYFCANASSPVLGESCGCPAGSSFDGSTCSINTTSSINVFDIETGKYIWFNGTVANTTFSYTIPQTYGNYSASNPALPFGLSFISAFNSSYYPNGRYITNDYSTKEYFIGLLSLNNSNAHQVNFLVLDSTNQLIDNAIVEAQINLNGTYIPVGSCLTDSVGTCSMVMSSAINYNMLVSKTGYSTLSQLLTPTLDSYTFILGSNATPTFAPDLTGITQSFTPDHINTCSNWTIVNYTIADSTGSLALFGLNVSYNGVVISTQTYTTPAIGRIVSINITTDGRYNNITVLGFFQKTGLSLSTYPRVYFLTNCTNQVWSLTNVAAATRAAGGGLTWIIFALFLTMLTVAWATKFVPMAIGGGILAVVVIFIIFSFVFDPLAMGLVMIALFITAIAISKLRSGQ